MNREKQRKKKGKFLTISLGTHTLEAMKEVLNDQTITSLRIDDEGDDPEVRFEWRKRQKSFHLGWLSRLRGLQEIVIDADVWFNSLTELDYLDTISLKRLSLRISHKNIYGYRHSHSTYGWFEPLTRCKALEELRIRTDHYYLDFSILSKCENLRSIDLSHSDIVGITLPSLSFLESIDLSHTNIVSKYMMENWWASRKKEFLWVSYPEDRMSIGKMPLAASSYTVVGLDDLLDLSQLRGCSSLKTIDLSNCLKLHSIDLSVLSGTGVRPRVIMTGTPIHQYCVDGFEGDVVFPESNGEGGRPQMITKM